MNMIMMAAIRGIFAPEVDASAGGSGEVHEIGAEDVTLLDLDNIEDMDFDSIEDPPGFVQPPDGVYDLKTTKGCIEKYKVKDSKEERKRFAIYYEIVAVIEISDTAEQEPKPGDKFSERFMMNEQGMKYWKGKAKAILGDVGKVSVANVLRELSSGTYQFRARITNKKSAGKKGTSNEGKEYNNTNVKVIGKAADIPGMGEEGAAQQSGDVAVE